MAWVCSVCSTNNPFERGTCIVCSAARFPEQGGERLHLWGDHPVSLNRAFLARRGFSRIDPLFHNGEKKYWLSSAEHGCCLGLDELLCQGILEIKDSQTGGGGI